MKIVLEAIEKLKEERQQETERNLPRIILEARRLARVQAKLNEIYRRSGEPGVPDSPLTLAATQTGLREGESKAGARNGNTRTNQPGEKDSSGIVPPDESREHPSTGRAGRRETESVEPDEDGKGEPRLELESNEGISEEQRKASEAAAILAARLRELSGRDPNVAHRYVTRMGEVSQEFRQAGMDFMGGNLAAASGHGGAGLSALGDVIDRLERLLDRPAPSDPATEEYPREFEALIAEYFRKLSFDQ
jgi:hypothetical protein